jgi:hypothetical protein
MGLLGKEYLILAHKVFKVHKVSRVPQDLVLKEIRAFKVHKVCKVHKVSRVLLEQPQM